MRDKRWLEWFRTLVGNRKLFRQKDMRTTRFKTNVQRYKALQLEQSYTWQWRGEEGRECNTLVLEKR
jgi:hypothetical protein